MSTLLQQLNHDLANVTDRVRRSLVQVQSGRHGAGSGLVVGAGGLVVTCAHVVRQRFPHVVLADGRRLRGQIIGYDEERDLAALAVEADVRPVAPLGDSADVRAGDVVVAVGHPWGVVGAATAGVVLSAGARWAPPLAGRDWIAADLHLRPGHSGGPLVSARGETVGLCTMLIGPDLGVAVPSDDVRAFLRRVGEERRRGRGQRGRGVEREEDVEA